MGDSCPVELGAHGEVQGLRFGVVVGPQTRRGMLEEHRHDLDVRRRVVVVIVEEVVVVVVVLLLLELLFLELEFLELLVLEAALLLEPAADQGGLLQLREGGLDPRLPQPKGGLPLVRALLHSGAFPGTGAETGKSLRASGATQFGRDHRSHVMSSSARFIENTRRSTLGHIQESCPVLGRYRNRRYHNFL